MFEVKNLSIKLDDKYIIKDLTLAINKDDKLAIIGEEGNGKSTLLKVMLGTCEYVEVTGKIQSKGNKIGYLEQSIKEENLQKKVYDYIFESEKDYYEKINFLYKYLEMFHLNDSILNQTINTLSGGEKVKIGILKLLLEESEILFLDEPTNDLDIETLKWLEKFMNETRKPIIFVSHDETLLSNTANKILHLEQIKKKTECRYTLLNMDYDTYKKERLKNIEKQTQIAGKEKREYTIHQEKLKKVIQKVEYQQNTISRSNPHGAKLLKKKMHSLKSQEKKLKDHTRTEVPDIEESIYFQFEEVNIPKNKKIIELNIKELKVKEKVLSKNIELKIYGNTHLCIIGKNGSGKSTLLKIIYENLKTRKDLKVGYMPQNYEDILQEYEQVLEFLVPTKNQEDITTARKYLGNMNFTKEEMLSKPKFLSNGTKAKLFLIKFVLEKCDVLILDEPTRNVSPLSNPVIRKTLKNFKGTIISVSHDRNYLSEVIDELYSLKPNGLEKIEKE